MSLDIRLLGRLEATFDGVSIVPTAAKPRRLLAMLALNAGHVVPTGSLMAELWGELAPRAASTSLYTYVSNLRRRICLALCGRPCRDVKRIIVTEQTGYSLRVRRSDTDVGRYEELARAGRAAAGQGDYEAASRRLGAALALWRGCALSDIAAGPKLSAEVVRLEANRVSDQDLRIEADLRLGRHRGLLGELAELCARFPLSENFYRKYVLALYRCGEQWRALQAYQRLRDTMVDELGVDPSAALQRLHVAVLRRQPALDDLAVSW